MILAYDCIIETRSNVFPHVLWHALQDTNIKKSGLESRDPGIGETSGFQSRDLKSFGIDTTTPPNLCAHVPRKDRKKKKVSPSFSKLPQSYFSVSGTSVLTS
jgi:hypothetical protein